MIGVHGFSVTTAKLCHLFIYLFIYLFIEKSRNYEPSRMFSHSSPRISRTGPFA